jgi:membrane protease YdiL (CAAX protease family)
LQLALFITSLAWFVASNALAGHAARGLCERFGSNALRLPLTELFLLFLLAVGFSILQGIAHSQGSLREVLGLPRRPTAGREWTIGAAVGWGMMALSVLPMALGGTLYVSLWMSPRAFWLLAVNLFALAIGSLVEEMAFRGYPYRRLIEAVGSVKATIGMSLIFGVGHYLLNPDSTRASLLITVLAGLLLSIAWLRTHGLWLGWGLHFAWNASMGVLFGLPVSGLTGFSTVIRTHAVGRTWITGGVYGPEAAFFTLAAVVVAIIVVVILTREYSWHYTHPPIISGGYPLDVAPPAAHTAMEAEAQARPVPLVQILSTTPGTMSVQPTPPPPRPLAPPTEDTF